MNILIVNEILPTEFVSGSELRLLQLAKELHEQGHALTFVGRFAEPNARNSLLESICTRVLSRDSERLRFYGIDDCVRWKFDQLLRSNWFDVAVLCLWFWRGISIPEHYMHAIRTFSGSTKIIVLTDDVHFLRERRRAQITGRMSDWERAEEYRSREIGIYTQADAVISISEADKSHLLEVLSHPRITSLPIVADAHPNGPSFASRSGIMYLGDFSNPASMEAIEWFIRNCWPTIQATLSKVELHIIGKKAPMSLCDLGNNITVHGYVSDLRPEFDRFRVFVAPLRYATGIPTKILLALSHGVPIVTTSVGTEGLGLQHSETAFVSDSPEGLASLVIRLYTDAAVWRTMAKKGRKYILSRFSKTLFARRVKEILSFDSSFAPNVQDFSPWSCLKVEDSFPEVLTFVPGNKRLEERCLAYLRLSRQLRRAGDPSEALKQARHVFAFFSRDGFDRGLYGPALRELSECYSSLGKAVEAQCCLEESLHASRSR